MFMKLKWTSHPMVRQQCNLMVINEIGDFSPEKHISKELSHAILGNFSTNQMVIEFAKISK